MGKRQGHITEEQSQVVMGEIVATISDKMQSATKDISMCNLVSYNLGNSHNKESASKLKEEPGGGVTGFLVGSRWGEGQRSFLGEKMAGLHVSRRRNSMCEGVMVRSS